MVFSDRFRNIEEKSCLANLDLPSLIRMQSINSFSIERQGIPLITSADGHSYLYDLPMGSWCRVTEDSFSLSDFVSSLRVDPKGSYLASLQNKLHPLPTGSHTQSLFKTDPSTQRAQTVAHLEVIN